MKISGFGNYPVKEVEFNSPSKVQDIAYLINRKNNLIARGCGNSYGDSALAENVISTRQLNCFLHFDDKAGVLYAESGVTLKTILETCVPKGFFIPVTPGTKYVTLGGMIASDVHGKNHHIDGSLMKHILFIDLMLPSGELIRCSQSENTEIFYASCGGMGLTGVILSAAIRLFKIKSTAIKKITIKTSHLNETIDLFFENDTTKYSVAWLDCFAKRNQMGRSLVMFGEHADEGELELPTFVQKKLPISLMSQVFTPWSLKLFNQLYYVKNKKLAENKRVSFDSYFYPLDKIQSWNGFYGKQGFLQYQFVLPIEASREGLSRILSEIAIYGDGSFLSVLKLFGEENEAYLSFPMKGFTLALDFRIRPKLFHFLKKLDVLVLAYGGRIYLTKDARLSKEMMHKMYSKLDQFLMIRDKLGAVKKFNSAQSIRLEI